MIMFNALHTNVSSDPKKKADLFGPYFVKNTLIEMSVTPSGDQISGPVSNF